MAVEIAPEKTPIREMVSPIETRKEPLSRWEVARRLWEFIRPHRRELFLGMTCGIFASQLQVAVGGMITKFVESLTPEKARLLALICIGNVLLYGVLGLMKYGQSVLLATVAQNVGVALRGEVYAHLQRLPLGFFHRKQTGSLLSTLTSDVPRLQNAATMVKDIVATPVMALVALVMMFVYSWKLTLSAMVVVPLMAMVIQRFTRALRDISRETQDRQADATAIMGEALAAPRIVRAFNAEQFEVNRFDQANQRTMFSQLKAIRRSARLGPVVDFIGATGVAAMLFVGGNEVLTGKMSVGQLIGYLFFAQLLANAVNSIGNLKSGFEEMMGAADRIFREVLEVEPEVADARGAKELPAIEGRIEFRNVFFAYNPGHPVLQNINLTIEPGQVVAFVGETGAGKTTLADLVPRFYDPTEGAVLVDGHDVRSVTLHSLRSKIAIVPQDKILFSGTIRENIAYGRRDALDAEIRAAARAANIDEFIESLPDGYETWVGERGATLSGGQQQRLAIARALVADPQILIFDEATSQLDVHTEALVQEALSTYFRGKTTLFIAHRLSTVVNADRIVVLKRGGIIAESGTHAELMARGGIYAALYETQRRTAETGVGDSSGEATGAAGAV